MLSAHKSDHSLGGNLPHTFVLNSQKQNNNNKLNLSLDIGKEYDYFRLVGTAANCGTDPLIGVSGFEIYGTIVFNKEN